jgi:regulator of cell morphogenesis and NO signaling
MQKEMLISIPGENQGSVRSVEKCGSCCNGKGSLTEACAKKQLRVQQNDADFLQTEGKFENLLPFDEKNAGQLINYILVHHHYYLKHAMPTIFSYIQKVVVKHGNRFPYMQAVSDLFSAIMLEMSHHIEEEEQILFPRIKELEAKKIFFNSSFIEDTMRVMDREYKNTIDLLYKIKNLTNNYTAPVGACASFQICLSELKEFEHELQQYFLLEQKLLFPLASKLLQPNYMA